MQKRYQLTFIALSLLALSAPALATVSMPVGYYVEGNVGQSRLHGKSYPGHSSDKGFGWNANLGYKFSPFMAAEAGYAHYASSRVKDNNGVQVATDRHYSYIITSKGMLPLGTTGLELFAKVGVARTFSKLSVNNEQAASASNMTFKTGRTEATGAYLAAGFDYALSPNMNVNVQWSRAKGNSNTGELELMAVGLTFLFS